VKCPRNPGTARYVRGQRIGNENRTLEFKLAQSNLENHLRDTVGKYVSAFLNSDGGTLMFGVDDRGK
jgi:predicted HTH transcriptional regulator